MIPVKLNDEDLGKLLDIANRFETLLDSDPPEEAVHRFIYENTLVLGAPRHPLRSTQLLHGVESKFPLSPDRIPDITSYSFQLGFKQYNTSAIQFIELKRPSARLYVDHNRLSKDLNDAWVESHESLRLFESNQHDIIRRLLKAASFEDVEINEIPRPLVRCIILIGRRSSLDSEALARTRQLSNSLSVRIFTYDYILDSLRATTETGTLCWWLSL